MKWFKHFTNWHTDMVICEAMSDFGPIGYSFFMILKEIYGTYFNETDDSGFLRISPVILCENMRIKPKTLPKLFNFFSERKRLAYWYENEFVVFKIPEFIKLASNWEKRKMEKR
jgi:hypothetical protein